MLREIALYELCREEWTRTETRLHLERAALAAREPAAPVAEPQTGIGRMVRRLAGTARPVQDRRAPLAP